MLDFKFYGINITPTLLLLVEDCSYPLMPTYTHFGHPYSDGMMMNTSKSGCKIFPGIINGKYLHKDPNWFSSICPYKSVGQSHGWNLSFF